MDGNVQVIYFVVGFCFCSEFYVGVVLKLLCMLLMLVCLES